MARTWKCWWVAAAVVAWAAHLPADTPPADEVLNIDPDASDPSAWIAISNTTGRDQTYQLHADTFVSVKDQSPAQTHSTKPTSAVQLVFSPDKMTIKAGDKQSIKATFSSGGRLLAGKYQSSVTIESVADAQVRGRKTVVVDVDPVISITAVSQDLDAGTAGRGPVSNTARFSVDANVQHLQFYVTATDLYLGDDPTKTDVGAIPLDTGHAADIRAVDAQAAAGNSSRFDTTPTQLAGMRAFNSQALTFDSRQSFGFRQDMFVTLMWQQNEASKPAGSYSGRIRLTALVMP